MGCIPMRKPIVVSQTDFNSNNNNTKKSISTTPIPKPSIKISDNSNLNLTSFPKPKTSIHHSYKIIQTQNSLIQNAYKVINKDTSNTFTMIPIPKSSIDNIDHFKSSFDKICKIKHKNIIAVNDLYEDSFYYYLICEYFSGNKLYEECSIEIGKYNEYSLSKIIKKIMKAIQILKLGGVHDYYVNPQNVFCNFTSNTNKIKVKVFYNQFFIQKGNCISDKLKNILNPLNMISNKEEWSLGVLMYSMLFGTISSYGENVFDDKKLYLQIKNSLISKRCKELLLSLLQVKNGNGMSCEIGLSSDFIVKANTMNIQKLEGKLLKGIKRFFFENCFYYKALLFCEDYFYINSTLMFDKQYNSDTNNNEKLCYSLYEMIKEKIKNEERDDDINVFAFINEIRLFRIKQQIYQMSRIFSKIENSKENIVLILSLSEHEIFKEVIKSIQILCNSKVNFDMFIKLFYDKLNDYIPNDSNYICKLIGNFQNIDIKDFNREFIILANKWYNSEDCFDMESLINDHCSSSNIDSSDNENENESFHHIIQTQPENENKN